jgi:hypothetical protein
MYIFTLVDNVRKVIEPLREQRGDFSLVMLYNTASLQATSNWNLIVSAKWTDALGTAKTTRLIAEALDKNLAFHVKGAISRVTVLKTSDPFVRDMTKLYPVADPDGTPIATVTAGEVSEGSAFVLYSGRAA